MKLLYKITTLPNFQGEYLIKINLGFVHGLKKRKTGKEYFELMRIENTCNTQAVMELSIVDEHENNK